MLISRRSALLGTAATVSLAAPLAAAEYLNPADDAYLVDLYRRWQTRREQVNNYIRTTVPDVSNEEFDALCGPVVDMQREIALTPARTLQGIAAKFRAHVVIAYDRPKFLAEDLDQDLDHLWGYDIDKLYVVSICRDLERLTGEASS